MNRFIRGGACNAVFVATVVLAATSASFANPPECNAPKPGASYLADRYGRALERQQDRNSDFLGPALGASRTSYGTEDESGNRADVR